jgi:hypothetical protein
MSVKAAKPTLVNELASGSTSATARRKPNWKVMYGMKLDANFIVAMAIQQSSIYGPLSRLSKRGEVLRVVALLLRCFRLFQMCFVRLLLFNLVLGIWF